MHKESTLCPCDEKKIPLIGIDRFRLTTDGTGIRTLIGTYGCTLNCKYCLNPQSIKATYKPMRLTPVDIFEKIKIDGLYFQATHGGITIGGGEPLLHIEKLEYLFSLCPKEWSKWVETSLNVDSGKVKIAAELFDHFIVDIKTMNPIAYYEYTGGNAEVAYENLDMLIRLVGTERITVRVPQIPGYVDAVSQAETERMLIAKGITDIDKFIYSVK